MPDRKKVIGICVGGFIFALLVVILLPMSFSGVEYYEFGFWRRKSTGTVDLTKVYTGGKYFYGPDVDFKIYKANAHFLELEAIDVFTQDKLEVKIDVHLQYFLRKDELPLLHEQYDVDYGEVMKSSAMDALKGAIPVYTTRELFLNRSQVERDLYMATRQRLGGTCCRPNCTDYADACPENCVPREACTDKEKGLHADVKYFQLTTITITEGVKDRYMEALVLDEKLLREELYQNASLIRSDTTKMIKEIKNSAFEITENAKTEAATIRDIAEANYTAIRETARSAGLGNLYRALNITTQESMNSFNYLRSLVGHNLVRLTVDFQQRIAGNL